MKWKNISLTNSIRHLALKNQNRISAPPIVASFAQPWHSIERSHASRNTKSEMKHVCENARAIRDRQQTDSVAVDLFPRKRIHSSTSQTGEKSALSDLRLHQIEHILPSCRVVFPATNRFHAFNATNTQSDL